MQNYRDCGDSLVQVKFPQRGATPEGIYDLAGNVWEWVSDYYAPYDSAEAIDPRGPEEGRPAEEDLFVSSRWVVRGGSISNVAGYLRASTRSNHRPEYDDDYRGFRVVWVSAGGQR